MNLCRHASAKKINHEKFLVYTVWSMESHASVASVDFDQASYYALPRKANRAELKPDQMNAIRHVYGGKDAGLCVVPYRVSAIFYDRLS